MKTDGTKKSGLKIASQEQHENAKNTRTILKDLQHAAYDKENLCGRSRTDKEAKFGLIDNEKAEKAKSSKKLASKSVQTGEAVITAEDLMSDEPGVDYWKRLAEKRGDALNDSLQENDKLKEQIDNLQEENRICKEMLEESRNLVEVLQDMLDESGVTTSHNTTEIGEEAREIEEALEVISNEQDS